MERRITRIIQIYIFVILFSFGIGLATIFNASEEKSFQIVEEANASISLTQSECDGYQQAKVSDDIIVTMCNCSTQRAEGQVVCGDGGSDPGEG